MVSDPGIRRDAPTTKATETMRSLGANQDRGLTTPEATARLRRDGANEVPEHKSHPLLRLARKFWGLSAWMLELIAILSIVLRKTTDVWIALALLVVNAVLGFIQEQRASTAISALRGRLSVMARVLRDGQWQSIPARTLVAGDIARVRTGDFVPADLQIIEGTLRVDQSALTGESREIDSAADATLYSGSVVREGEATAVVVATGLRTYFGRTAHLVESAQPKLHVEEVIARVVRWLFVIVASMVAVTLMASWAEGLPLIETLPIALVVLMSAVPVALPVMFTVSMALGSLELSRLGVLITRLSAVEDAATLDVLCADKTGTLTMNRLALANVSPQPGFTEEDVLRAAVLASNAANADPIDQAFLRVADERHWTMSSARPLSFTPFSASTRRTEAVVDMAGRKVRCVKGALRSVAEATGLDAGTVGELEARAVAEATKGLRTLAVARSDGDGPLELLGLAHLYDPPRPDSRQLIDELRSLGVQVKMLTGDALAVAREMARLLGLGEIVRAPELQATHGEPVPGSVDAIARADGLAEVFPEDKFLVVKALQGAHHVVGMTGDGVNDAPALRQAEVGIAVSGATDVAKGAASAVLTTEGLGGIVDLVRNGRAIYQRVLTWIVNKVSRTIMKAGLVVIAFLFTGKFVISALGMVLLVFLTDFVKIALATDRVRPSQSPETWNIGPLVAVAVALGLLMLAESLALLAFGWHYLGLATDGGRLHTFTFQTLLFFAIFSILSVRERRSFWSSRPSALLAAALAADAVLGAVIGLTGLGELQPLPPSHSALIFLSAGLLVLGPNDVIKVVLTRRAVGT